MYGDLSLAFGDRVKIMKGYIVLAKEFALGFEGYGAGFCGFSAGK